VIANARAANEERMRSYGVAETVDHTRAPLRQQVQQSHPDGIDVLVDLASDAEAFAALAAIVREGGTALTTRYVANPDDLRARGVTAVNFQVPGQPSCCSVPQTRLSMAGSSPRRSPAFRSQKRRPPSQETTGLRTARPSSIWTRRLQMTAVDTKTEARAARARACRTTRRSRARLSAPR